MLIAIGLFENSFLREIQSEFQYFVAVKRVNADIKLVL